MPSDKACSRCGEVKKLTAFGDNGAGGKKTFCMTCHSAYCLARYHKHRRAVVAAYGGQCVCCGEDEYVFLEVDHIKGDGAKDRARFGNRKGGSNWYAWIVKQDFPEGLQILCANCHLAKTKDEVCPHKR